MHSQVIQVSHLATNPRAFAPFQESIQVPRSNLPYLPKLYTHTHTSRLPSRPGRHSGYRRRWRTGDRRARDGFGPISYRVGFRMGCRGPRGASLPAPPFFFIFFFLFVYGLRRTAQRTTHDAGLSEVRQRADVSCCLVKRRRVGKEGESTYPPREREGGIMGRG